MSPAHVLEPTYRSLKRQLMEGIWPPGLRLETGRLADELGVSMTPVRDSLNQLVGEGLVEFRAGEGFRVARMSEGLLRDLLELNAVLLDRALGLAQTCRPIAAMQPELDHASRVSILFCAIANWSGNTVLTAAVQRIGERLHSIRTLDPHVIQDADEEIERIRLAAAMHQDQLPAKIAIYHCKRQNAAGQYIRLLEQALR